MKIGLRVLYNAAWMGGVHYVLNIARMLRSLPADERPHVTFLTASPDAEQIARDNADAVDAIAPFSAAREGDFDLVYPATQVAEAPFGARWAGWIPDWQCRHYPDMFPDEERTRRFLQYRMLATEPAVCVLSSQQALADTRRLFPDTKTALRVFHFPAMVDDEAVARTPADLADTRARFEAPRAYMIVCNQFWRHKNHVVVLEALDRARDLDIHVVMTGEIDDTRWPDYAAEIKRLATAPHIASRLTLTGRIARQDQIDLMLGAAGFIQPSLFEGWSTFVEESRAFGLPGLLSDIPVHREQNPPGAAFFDAEDPNALAGLMTSWWSNRPERMSAEAARTAQARVIADAARSFLAIAEDTRARHQSERHDLESALARVLPALRADVAAGALEQADYDRFLAGVRLHLRQQPEDLARVAGLLCADGDPYADEALKLVVLATLAKCDGAARAAFFEFDAETAFAEPEHAEALERTRSNLSAPTVQGRLALRNAFFRARDFAKRKLNA